MSAGEVMKVCSLFSGIGGIDLGFMQAGFEIVWANEFDRDAARTYRHNFGNEHLVEKDIRKVDVATIPDFDVLVAGFPCQPFSILGKQRGFEDSRGMLFYEIERVVKAKRPQVIFLENVANLIEHDDGKTFLTVYNTLVPYGYSFRYRVMDAIEYGNVPQHRTRIFIVAFLDNDKCERFEFPEKIKRTTKLNDIIKRSEIHDKSYYYTESSEYYDDLNKVAQDKQALYRIFENGVSAKPYYVSPTLVASMGAFMHRVPVVRDDYGIRMITPYECLALQGFPKDYRFPKIPIASAYKQCGNSVVVPVIKRIAECVLKVFKEER